MAVARAHGISCIAVSYLSNRGHYDGNAEVLVGALSAWLLGLIRGLWLFLFWLMLPPQSVAPVGYRRKWLRQPDGVGPLLGREASRPPQDGPQRVLNRACRLPQQPAAPAPARLPLLRRTGVWGKKRRPAGVVRVCATARTRVACLAAARPCLPQPSRTGNPRLRRCMCRAQLIAARPAPPLRRRRCRPRRRAPPNACGPRLWSSSPSSRCRDAGCP